MFVWRSKSERAREALEGGQGSRLSTLIKVLKVLGLENQLETLIPPRR